jgi:hypothetical protein
MSLLTFYPLFVLDSEWQERFVYLRPVEQPCLVKLRLRGQLPGMQVSARGAAVPRIASA